jgi:hypothetical protein
MPFEVMCHDRAMKQESTVYQFHNIYPQVSPESRGIAKMQLTLILQLPPMLMPPPPCDMPVLDATAALPVAVCVMPAIPDMPDIATDVADATIVCPEWFMVTARVFDIRASD